MKSGFKPKKFLSPKSLFSIPRDPKDFFAWAVKRLFFMLGGGYVLGFFAFIIAAGSLMAFMVGDYQGNGNGSVDANGNITLNSATQAKEQALRVHYDEVAAQWQKGLSQAQIQQVQVAQADTPSAVLMAIEKLVDNFDQDHAAAFYKALQPTLTWKPYTTETITYQNVTTTKTVKGKKVSTTKCVQKVANSTVDMLVSATTWDGSITNTYTMKSTGTKSCPKTGTSTWTNGPVLGNTKRTYYWSRVWSLLKQYPATGGGIITNTQENKDMLAGLIASMDYTITDPEVQQMVQTLLFTNSSAISLPSNIKVGPPDKDTVQNVLRWKDYIVTLSKKYNVPATLVAGQMAQESGGNQYDASGAVLSSGAGAMGLMQVEPYTAAGMYLNGQLIGNNAIAYLSNPLTNMEIGIEYISEMYHEFNNDVDEELSAYNAGPGGEDYALGQGYKVAQNSQTEEYVAIITQTWMPAFVPTFGPA